MASIAIVGGHGKISRLLIPLLVEAGHLPVALIRKAEQVDALTRLGAKTRILDIENSSVEQFAEAFEGCSVVVFAAGGGTDGNAARKQSVDLGGSVKSAAAAQLVGIKRFVQISAIGVDVDPDLGAGDTWVAYVTAKREADRNLRGTTLDWTIVRPGALTNDEPTSKISLGMSEERGHISRADVAAVLAAAIDDDRTIGKQWNLISGSRSVDEAIDDALRD